MGSRRIRVAIVEEHEIFRRGLEACLGDEPGVELVVSQRAGPLPAEADIAVVSPRAATRESFSCPIVVCAAEEAMGSNALDRERLTVLSRQDLSAERLIAAVRALAAGLRVRCGTDDSGTGIQLADREREVLRLLSDGADTRDIARSLSYSERTVKGIIQQLERQLGATSRAQVVAVGIRRGLI